MKASVRVGLAAATSADLLVVGFFEEPEKREKQLRGLGEAVRALLQPLIEYGDFTGKSGQTALILNPAGIQARRLLAVGLGEQAKFDLETLRKAATLGAQQAQKLRQASVTYWADTLRGRGIDDARLAEALVEAAILSQFAPTELRTRSDDPAPLLRCEVVSADRAAQKTLQSGAEIGRIIAIAANDARALIALPGNIATPERLAAEARKLAKLDKVQVRVLDEVGIRRERMHALLAVGQGSTAKPRFIIVEYQGAPASEPPVVLIGKGVTFDTGGINLKGTKNIENMNYDKSGGVAVLAAARVAAALGLPLRLVALIPAVENMVSGNAMRPGDVIRTRAGKTVEVNNTDAEGRLILADALDYAQRYKPAAVVDIATLTGACVVALGEQTIGVLGTDDRIKRSLRSAGEAVHEPVWELPLWDEHQEEMSSDVADLKNSGGPAGGAITAAAFLRAFAGDAPWAHLDIAGPAWAKSAKGYIPKGATAAGTRLLIQFLRDWADGRSGGATESQRKGGTRIASPKTRR